MSGLFMHPLSRFFLALLLSAHAVAGWATGNFAESTTEFGRFGKVTLYAPAAEASRVVLFISGDGGWNLGVVDMARELAGLDALVVGIDIRHYLKSLEAGGDKCAYPAADFEMLGQFVQKKLGYRQFHRPVLVGYSSGATLAYAALAQAPSGTFAGAISLGFCSDLLLHKPSCKGSGLSYRTDPKLGQIYEPSPYLTDPWVVLHGDQDQVCALSATAGFVDKIAQARLVVLPKVGHGFSVTRNWLPQFKQSLSHMGGPSYIQAQPPLSANASINDLPLVESAAAHDGDMVAVLLTGDGGWAGLDKDVAAALAARGISVIGWDSLHYYWTPRSPDSAAADLARVLTHYRSALKRNRFILVGYSFGAEVLPFLVNRLPPELKPRVASVVLLGPGRHAHFEFQLTDWLGGSEDGMDVHVAVNGLAGMKVRCIYGSDEHNSLCPQLEASTADNIALPGSHHFGGDYSNLARLIIESATVGNKPIHPSP